MSAKASERAIKPSVLVTEWGIFKSGEITPTNASYTCQLNSPPSISLGYSVTPETADNAAIETKSTSVLQRLGQQQVASFEGKKVTDAYAILRADEQDAVDSLYFYGFACCDTFGVSAGSINTSGTAAVQWTEIEALNYSIYSIEEKNTDKYSSGIEGESFVDIILNLEKQLYESWTDEVYTVKKKDDERQAELQKKVHERNGELRHYFQAILKDSKTSIGWPKINRYLTIDTRKGGDKTKPAGRSLRESIAAAVCKILQNGGGSFLGQLLQIGELFQCVFVPSIISQVPGKFVNKATAVGGKAESLTLDIINFSGRAASSFGLLPVSHVYIKPPPPNNTMVYAREKGICAPKEAAAKGGAQIELPPPPWWFPSINTITDAVLSDAAKSPKKGKRKTMVTDVYPEVEANIKSTKEQTDMEFDVGYMWAMIGYAWSVLAGSTATISVPGTFKIEPGKRYEVKNSKGDSMFTGFLTGFSTSISPGSCLTNLVFSHIMFPGFKLPGADELKAAGILSD